MKSELLQAVEWQLFLEQLRQWKQDYELSKQQAKNRAAAKKLERLGML